MGRYFRRRLLTAIPVFFGITFLVFVLLSLSPADVTDLGEGDAFLAIQVEGSSVLDFLRRAACFLFLQQQYYKWLGNERESCGN